MEEGVAIIQRTYGESREQGDKRSEVSSQGKNYSSRASLRVRTSMFSRGGKKKLA